ncbi:hypothetical protein PR202_ga25597 [Eleusine coracana subsp. coracana]|uniref:Uncharacterized protein n=1 Tax=Eleusine coracana subsp. coracana TaxID=191504 RepID=A0AAV5D9P6_ELECO|nr:hypothetical protein PR202_ga25597 [Eleusine coracana subsp. coracana]
MWVRRELVRESTGGHGDDAYAVEWRRQEAAKWRQRDAAECWRRVDEIRSGGRRRTDAAEWKRASDEMRRRWQDAGRRQRDRESEMRRGGRSDGPSASGVELGLRWGPNRPMLFPTGLALLIEKKSRRIEISLYCVARAIESLFTCIVDAGLCPVMLQIKRPDIVVFSIATSIIMHCYDQERDAFRSKYLNVLDWVCGDPGTIHR